MRNNKKLMAKFRKNPEEKIAGITKLVSDEISKHKELQDWGITLSSEPYNFDARVLDRPRLIHGQLKKGETCTDIVNKFSFYTPILEPVKLLYENWALIYDAQDYAEANHLLDTLKAASAKFGTVVEEPYWIEV